MNRSQRRRVLFQRAGLLGLMVPGLVTACSQQSSHKTTVKPQAPVRISHLFGSTIIPQPPRQVVCAGYTGQDDVLALGVVPLAITEWFGNQPFGVWPWSKESLGDARPALLHLDSGIQIEKINALSPDLIIATNAGLDNATYQELANIAPTIAQTTSDAFFEPWKIQASVISQALYQPKKMLQLINNIERLFANVIKTHPQLKGFRVALFSGQLEKDSVAAITDWHTDFLSTMGCTVVRPPVLIPLNQLQSFAKDIDGIIWISKTVEERQSIMNNPLIQEINRYNIFPSVELSAAIAFASPLSYPFVAAQLPDLLMDKLH